MIESKSIMWLLVGAASMLLSPIQILGQDVFHGPDASKGDPALDRALDRVYSKLQPRFQKYYPKVVSTNFHANGIHFEYEVKTFEFPSPTNAAGKIENRNQRGPKKGGVLCSIWIEKGKYSGQLALWQRGDGQYEPHLIDRKVYKQLLMASYSTKRDAHLWVSLSYPSDASDDFVREFRALMKEFEQDAD